jgi:hypothetical protein
MHLPCQRTSNHINNLSNKPPPPPPLFTATSSSSSSSSAYRCCVCVRCSCCWQLTSAALQHPHSIPRQSSSGSSALLSFPCCHITHSSNKHTTIHSSNTTGHPTSCSQPFQACSLLLRLLLRLIIAPACCCCLSKQGITARQLI